MSAHEANHSSIPHVYFLGPEGTFTHAATLRVFDASARMDPVGDIPSVFEALARDQNAFGVVPIENSIEGSVSFTLEALLDPHTPRIVAEIVLTVEQCLMSDGGDLAAIEEVFSHAHGLAQCKHWLRHHLPNAKRTSVGSTAAAALLVKGNPTHAAIASELAAQRAGVSIIARNIQDSSNNATRFLVLGRQTPAPTGHDKTSIVFGARHQRGALHRLLGILNESDINLSRIESRPMPGQPWQYIFYADLEGHERDPHVRAALHRLQEAAPLLRVLGSYPRSPDA